MQYVAKEFLLSFCRSFLVLCAALFLAIYFAENGAVTPQTLLEYENIFVFLVIALLIYKSFHFLRYYRLYALPYSLKLFNRVNDEQKESKIYVDKFKRYDRKTKTYYFKNALAINKEAYMKAKDQIAQLLGFANDKSIELEISTHSKKEVAIRVFKLPVKIDWYRGHHLRQGLVFLGLSKDGECFLPFENLTSSICCGESGSGKSNFLNMVIFSFLHNSDRINKLHFIDLKGVELSRYKLNNTTFTDTLEGANTILENLKQTMNQRFQEMKQKGDLIFNGNYEICLIDEIGSISTHYEKKLKEQIFNNLIEIGQKGRASKVLLFIFSQKIDATNIPTNVLTNLQSSFLLRTSSQFNINNTIGLQEEIEEITRTRVQDFPKGRMIYKDGLNSQKVLLQVPYLSQEAQNDMIHYFQSWINNSALHHTTRETYTN